jgi:hypothetical protein
MDKPVVGSAFRPAELERPPPLWLLALAVPFWLTVWYANRPPAAVHSVPSHPTAAEDRCFERRVPRRQRDLDYYYQYRPAGQNHFHRLGDFPTQPRWMLVDRQASRYFAY